MVMAGAGGAAVFFSTDEEFALVSSSLSSNKKQAKVRTRAKSAETSKSLCSLLIA